MESPFKPVIWVHESDTDQFTYEPAGGLVLSLDCLDRATQECLATPSFDNVADACRKCRTAFAEFIGEALTSGATVRNRFLPRVEDLLGRCLAAVTAALPKLSEEERSLAHGYIRHIEDRIGLACALRTHALPGYLDEIEARLSKASLVSQSSSHRV
jgi:hypothetical protein